MKRRIPLIAVLFAAVALAVTPLVMAGPGGHGAGSHGPGFGPGGGMGMQGAGMQGMGILGHLQRAKEELDLTDAQVEQLQAIFAALQEQNAPYRDQMHEGMKGAVTTLLANPNDIAGAQALLDQQAATERTMKTNMLNATSKALLVLSAEQRAELGTMIQNFAEHHGRRRGR